MKRIKESITEIEYKKLLYAVRGNEDIRERTKQNLIRTFCLLYFTGLRINEVQEVRVKHIVELLKDGFTKIAISKTDSERKLYVSDDFKKSLRKYFDTSTGSDDRVIYN